MALLSYSSHEDCQEKLGCTQVRDAVGHSVGREPSLFLLSYWHNAGRSAGCAEHCPGSTDQGPADEGLSGSAHLPAPGPKRDPELSPHACLRAQARLRPRAGLHALLWPRPDASVPVLGHVLEQPHGPGAGPGLNSGPGSDSGSGPFPGQAQAQAHAQAQAAAEAQPRPLPRRCRAAELRPAPSLLSAAAAVRGPPWPRWCPRSVPPRSRRRPSRPPSRSRRPHRRLPRRRSSPSCRSSTTSSNGNGGRGLAAQRRAGLAPAAPQRCSLLPFFSPLGSLGGVERLCSESCPSPGRVGVTEVGQSPGRPAELHCAELLPCIAAPFG